MQWYAVFLNNDNNCGIQAGKQIRSSLALYSIVYICVFLTDRMYQLPATIPIDRTLEITVMDRDVLSDDLIGTTTVDLENRYLTKHMAHCGLPKSFHKLVNVPVPTNVATFSGTM